jgi:hypothetical protein
VSAFKLTMAIKRIIINETYTHGSNAMYNESDVQQVKPFNAETTYKDFAQWAQSPVKYAWETNKYTN